MLKKMTELNVKLGLQLVLSKIEAASAKRPQEFQCVQPKLVAVGKTKPLDLIIEVYNAGQRHFGENYVQELEEKASHPDALEKCPEIKWHYIGHLQSNKVNKVIALKNLYMIETIDSEKLANTINKQWPKYSTGDNKLKVMIQVNTSGEKGKNGIPPNDVLPLAEHIVNECTNLYLDGLMTIGRLGYKQDDGPNPDFVCLKNCRDEVCESLGFDWKRLNLSMGMSDDFEHAIEMGSTNVRVGSSIFGYRAKKTPN